MPEKYSIHLYIICFYMANAAFMPFLGFWFLEQGLTNQQIGLLSSIGPLVGLAAQPVWGWLSDRFGAEKRVLMLSLVLAPTFAFGYLLASDVFLVFLVTALLYSLFFTSIAPISDAMTVAHAQRHGQSYGSIRVLGSISFALIITPLGFLYNRTGTDAMFVVHLITMLAALAALTLVPKPKISGLRRESLLSGVSKLLKERHYVWFLLLVLVVAVGNHFNNVFFSVFVGELGGNVSERIGMLNTVSALSELPFFILSAYLIRRFGYFPILMTTALAGAVRWFVLSLEPSFPMLMTNQLLHGITFAMFMAAGVTYAYQMSPEGLKNTGQTLFAVVNYNLANLIASNGGGWLIDYSGFSDLYRTGAILSLLGAAGFWLLSRRRHEPLHKGSS